MAHLKGEYQKVMTEAGGTRKVEGKGGSNNVAGNEPSTTIKQKRKERNEEKPSNRANVKVGDRVKAKFDDGDWYEGSVSSVKRGKVGEVVRVWIDYDDNSKEESKWPDKDIVLLGREDGGKKKRKKLKSKQQKKAKTLKKKLFLNLQKSQRQ